MNNSGAHFIKKSYLRVFLLVVGLGILVLGVVWVRALYGSMQAFHQGEACLKNGQYVRAINFFDRSIRWYAPINPYVRRSAERLWEIGVKSEKRGDIRLSLIAARTIRRGFYAARSFYTPGTSWIKRCDVKINDLMRVEQVQQKLQDASARPSKPEFEIHEVKSPSTLWSIVVEIGFIGWIASAIGFIMFSFKGPRKAENLTSFSGEPRLERQGGFTSNAIFWGGSAFIFFVLWIVGMMKA